MFEATTTFSRLKSVGMLRSMRNQKNNVWVYRNRKWTEVDTTKLLPHDIFSLSKSKDKSKGDTVVPCDALILRGSAVVNESSLTGESTPQMKAALVASGEAASQPLNMDHGHRVHILYSGTVLNQHTGPAAVSSEEIVHKTPQSMRLSTGPSPQVTRPPVKPPNSGCSSSGPRLYLPGGGNRKHSAVD